MTKYNKIKLTGDNKKLVMQITNIIYDNCLGRVAQYAVLDSVKAELDYLWKIEDEGGHGTL